MKTFFQKLFIFAVLVILGFIIIGCASQHPPNYGQSKVNSTHYYHSVSADGLTTQKVEIVRDGFEPWSRTPQSVNTADRPVNDAIGAYDYGAQTSYGAPQQQQPTVVIVQPWLYMTGNISTAGSRDPYYYRTRCRHGIRAYGCEYCGTLPPRW